MEVPVESAADMLALLKDTTTSLGGEDDLAALDRMSESKRRLQDLRERRILELREMVQSLKRDLEAQRASQDSAAESEAQAELEQESIQLERQKLALAKSINEIESTHASNLATLERLQHELDTIQNTDVEQELAPTVDDTTLLKLKLYRSLGVSLDSDDVAKVQSVLVRSSQDKSVHVLKLDNEYSSHFIANYLWDRM